MGHFFAVIRFEEAGNKLFPLGKEKVQRCQNPNPEADKRRAEQSKAFRGILCNALRRNLTKNQNNDCYNGRRNRRTNIAVKVDEQKRADGRYHDIHNIVANQDGGNQLVIVFGQPERQCCPLVSVVCQHLEAGLIQGRERRFRGAEIGGHGNADHHGESISKIIHFNLLYVLFIQSFHAKKAYLYPIPKQRA